MCIQVVQNKELLPQSQCDLILPACMKIKIIQEICTMFLGMHILIEKQSAPQLTAGGSVKSINCIQVYNSIYAHSLSPQLGLKL